jgi:hypothetical protein
MQIADCWRYRSFLKTNMPCVAKELGLSFAAAGSAQTEKRTVIWRSRQ